MSLINFITNVVVAAGLSVKTGKQWFERVTSKWHVSYLGGRQNVDRQGSTLTHIGGYALTGLDQIFGTNAWDLYTMAVPKKENGKAAVEAMLHHAAWATVRKGKIHMLFKYANGVIDTRWGFDMLEFGVRVLNEPKVIKRLAGLMSRRALAYWTDELKVLTIPRDAFTTITSALTDEQKEIISEGAGLLSRTMYEKMVDKWEQRVTMTHGAFEIQQMALRFERAIYVNLRAFTKDGSYKGNFKISDLDVIALLAEKFGEKGVQYDIVVFEESLKGGVYMPEGHCYITAEVQEWHPVVYTDPQSMINMRALFTLKHVDEITKDFFGHLHNQVKYGNLIEHAADLINVRVNLMKDADGNFDWIEFGNRWAAAEWVARGGDIRDSSFALRNVAKAKAKLVLMEGREGKPDKFKIPVPCAWYMQVISHNAAVLMGYKGKVPTGSGRVWSAAHVVILSDEDWLKHYIRFGGHDMDDFFKVVFRTVNGEKKLIIWRSPNGLGEYGIFDYIEGDDYPKWAKADDSIVEFPEVVGKLPKQIDIAIQDGESIILEGALEEAGDELYTGTQITRDDIMWRILAESSAKASAGMMVNSIELWYLAMKKHIPVSYGTLEKYIDLTTQEDLTASAAISLRFFATLLVAEVINSGAEIDKKFWEDRSVVNPETGRPGGFEAMISDLVKEGVIPRPNLVETGENAFFTRRHEEIVKLRDKFLDFAEAQANKATPPYMLRELGALGEGSWGDKSGAPSSGGAALLRAFRKVMWATAPKRPDGSADFSAITDAQWADMRAQLLYNLNHERLNYRQDEWPHEGVQLPQIDVYNNVLGLALACYDFRSGYGSCQFHGCNLAPKGAWGAYKIGEHTVCPSHHRQIKNNPKLKKYLDPTEFNDMAVMNQAVFPLYMEAMEFFGILGPVGGGKVKQEFPVTCSNCGDTHTFVNHHPKFVVAYQKFLTLGSRCKKCRNATTE